jgi:tagatose 6-phosphate kinase
MFLCVSPNPAIDKRMTLAALVPGEIHRARTVQAFPGGKSTHVAMVLKALGAEPHWIGLCGGLTGSALLAGLNRLGIKAQASSMAAETRTNLEIIDDAGVVTEIREPGEPVSAAELAAFELVCTGWFEKGREAAIVIFSGSLPVGAPPDFYATLIAAARKAGCRTFLDTSGEPLRLALASHPHFIKPNRDEAAGVLNSSINSRDAAANALSQFLSRGACSVALSLGSEGLLYSSGKSEPILFAPAVPVAAKSTVGCGDAALAGFAFATASGSPREGALCTAAACAAANCLADSPGAVRKEIIDKFQSQVRIESFNSGP